MGLYDAIKDFGNLLKKTGNIDLQQQVVDFSAQALELQSENAKLQQENITLKKQLEIADDIERYKLLFVTRKSDATKIKYCSHCWDSGQKLIQVDCFDSGQFTCPHCKTKATYDPQKYTTYNDRRGFNVIGR
ncbi:MAG: hypothetical protein FWC94_02735 [Bacteroidales bacterium]|nr:hypothetical protein [Bacteroidales bacterium]